MKSKLFILALAFLLPLAMQAQLGRLAQKAKDKVNQRVDAKTDKAIDDALDKAEGKQTDVAVNNNASDSKTSTATDEEPAAKSYAKYDFVAGESIIYFNNFETDADSELPLGWNTSGTGEVVTFDKFDGKWLRMHKPFVYLADNKKQLGDNYTIEFDVIMQLKNNGWMYPTFSFGMFAYNNDTANMNNYLKDRNKYASLVTTVFPGEFKSSKVKLESFAKASPYFTSDVKAFETIEKSYGSVIHVAMQAQKERFRVWINESKVFDVPKAIPAAFKMDQIFFQVGSTNYAEEQYGMYVSNVKIAEGLPDTRHKLVEEGTFSTTSILFDVNKATLKPESSGAIKEIADVLKQYKDIRIKITGHTDSDGNADNNLTLSQKRAEAVKSSLINDYGIEDSRIETEGKGATKPIAENTTKEGKAANRRVEFTKL